MRNWSRPVAQPLPDLEELGGILRT